MRNTSVFFIMNERAILGLNTALRTMKILAWNCLIFLSFLLNWIIFSLELRSELVSWRRAHSARALHEGLHWCLDNRWRSCDDRNVRRRGRDSNGLVFELFIESLLVGHPVFELTRFFVWFKKHFSHLLVVF